MYKHLLIATDGSDVSHKALDHGLGLAKALQAKVSVVTVTEGWDVVVIGEAAIVFPPEQYEKAAAANADHILAAARRAVEKPEYAGLDCEFVHMTEHHPAEGIIEAAKDKGCDLIVMASHGRRGLSRLVLGSEANEVVTRSPLPVLICR